MEEQVLEAVRAYLSAYEKIEPNVAVRHSFVPTTNVNEDHGMIGIVHLKKMELQQDVVKYATDRIQRTELSARVEILSKLAGWVVMEHDCQSQHFTGKTKSAYLVCQDKYGVWKVATSWQSVVSS
jgi:hypothetical protein